MNITFFFTFGVRSFDTRRILFLNVTINVYIIYEFRMFDCLLGVNAFTRNDGNGVCLVTLIAVKL